MSNQLLQDIWGKSPRRPNRETIRLGGNGDCLETKNLKKIKKKKKTIKKGHSDNFLKFR